jgi:hypothetical protein
MLVESWVVIAVTTQYVAKGIFGKVRSGWMAAPEVETQLSGALDTWLPVPEQVSAGRQL